MVSVALPESRQIVVEEFDPTHPLHRLPGIKMRDHQPQRIAMVWLQRLAVVVGSEENVVTV